MAPNLERRNVFLDKLLLNCVRIDVASPSFLRKVEESEKEEEDLWAASGDMKSRIEGSLKSHYLIHDIPKAVFKALKGGYYFENVSNVEAGK